MGHLACMEEVSEVAKEDGVKVALGVKLSMGQ